MTAGRTHARAPGRFGPVTAPKVAPPTIQPAPERSAGPAGAPPSLQAQLLRAERLGHQLGSVPVEGPPLAERIRAAAGGQQLSYALRGVLAPSVGAVPTAVRLHTDSAADAPARDLDAAFTSGPHIFFRAGAFQPRTAEGLGLLAHVVEHARQQAVGPVAGTPAPGGVALSGPGDRFERAADAAAARVTGLSPAPIGAIATPAAMNAAANVAANSFAPTAIQRAPLVPVQRVRLLPRGKIRGLLPRALRSGGRNMYEHFFGAEPERRAITINTAKIRQTGVYGAVDDVAISSTNGNTLRGRFYHPTPAPNGAARPGDGVTVLVLSGSGGSSENYTEPIAREYTDLGADVLAVNYRGFGESGTRNRRGVGSSPTQAGVYEDAVAMFNYLRQVKQVQPKDIVVHGYSLGGGVAADLVSELTKQLVRVRGLVLHSAIPSAPEPAQAAAGPLAGALTGALVGQFDTRTKLARIGAAYPDLKVHFTSGDANDHLGIGANDLVQRAAKLFNPGSVTQDIGKGGHLAVFNHLRSPGTQAALRGILNSDAYQQQQEQQVGDVATQTLQGLEQRSTAKASDIYNALDTLQGALGRTNTRGPTARFTIRAVRLLAWPAPVEVDLAYPRGVASGAFDRSLAERQVRDVVAAIAGGPVDVRIFGAGLYGRERSLTG